MALKKGVVFNLWGGILTSSPEQVFVKYEKSLGLPSGFISKCLAVGGAENPLSRAEIGKITLQELLAKLEEDCKKEASAQGLNLPAEFSPVKLFEEVRGSGFHKPILEAVAALRHHGVATCVLANLWVDDTPQRHLTARILFVLEGHFDLVLSSCRTGTRVPESAMFSKALESLGLTPQQVVWLDADQQGVIAAEGLGMTGLLMQADDPTTTLTKLQAHTGVEFQSTEERVPAACKPEEVTHGNVTIKPGVQLHFVEMGDGPPILLCHGFPESWYSWRYQIPALADAGFRVIAPDLIGYGDSSAPEEIEAYSQENICKDMLLFMDKLGIAQATVIGHDWGGALVWNLAQFYPERIRAVVSLNTPLFPLDTNSDPMEKLKSLPIFDYQIYFQKPGVAEAELEKDLERTFKIFFYPSREEASRPPISTAKVCERGGLFVGLPEEIPRSTMLTETALQYYVQQYRKSGFRGPLNWYRNVHRNWEWMCSRPRPKILMPALMVTAGKDMVLLPIFSQGMDSRIPNLSRGQIEECGHWTQMDRPAELNKILIPWLKETHQKTSTCVTPKL